MNSNIRLFLVGWLMLSLLHAGCGGRVKEGPPRAASSGTVSLNGQPLVAGTIQFVPIDGTPGAKTSTAIVDGKFRMETRHGPVVGNHKVEVIGPNPGGIAPDDEHALDQLRTSKTRNIEAIVIPPQYNTHSILKATVTADGPNQFQFDLISKRR